MPDAGGGNADARLQLAIAAIGAGALGGANDPRAAEMLVRLGQLGAWVEGGDLVGAATAADPEG